MVKDCPVWIGANNVTVNGFTTQNSGNTWYHDSGVHIGWFDYSSLRDCKVFGNNIINNYDGIYALFPEYHYIGSNNIENNRNIGVYLHGSGSRGRVEIDNNSIKENSNCGIYIQDPDDNIISKNTIINNGEAGLLISTFGNHIFKNKIINHRYGIKISAGNFVESNSIEENKFGIFVLNGRNKIAKNNFIRNDQHAYFELFKPLRVYKNRWIQNFWEGHHLGPKIIKGMVQIFFASYFIIGIFAIFYILEMIDENSIIWKCLELIRPRFISTMNFDWHPAKEPYII